MGALGQGIIGRSKGEHAMNRKQLMVIWVLALWLSFAVVYSSYYPGYTRPEPVPAQGKLTGVKVSKDPAFLGLPLAEQQKVLLEIDPLFAALSPGEQSGVLAEINRPDSPAEWYFDWQDDTLMVLSLPAILLAIPLLLTLRNRKAA